MNIQHIKTELARCQGAIEKISKRTKSIQNEVDKTIESHQSSSQFVNSVTRCLEYKLFAKLFKRQTTTNRAVVVVPYPNGVLLLSKERDESSNVLKLYAQFGVRNDGSDLMEFKTPRPVSVDRVQENDYIGGAYVSGLFLASCGGVVYATESIGGSWSVVGTFDDWKITCLRAHDRAVDLIGYDDGLNLCYAHASVDTNDDTNTNDDTSAETNDDTNTNTNDDANTNTDANPYTFKWKTFTNVVGKRGYYISFDYDKHFNMLVCGYYIDNANRSVHALLFRHEHGANEWSDNNTDNWNNHNNTDNWSELPTNYIGYYWNQVTFDVTTENWIISYGQITNGSSDLVKKMLSLSVDSNTLTIRPNMSTKYEYALMVNSCYANKLAHVVAIVKTKEGEQLTNKTIELIGNLWVESSRVLELTSQHEPLFATVDNINNLAYTSTVETSENGYNLVLYVLGYPITEHIKQLTTKAIKNQL